jgi:addiction module HigA family antidote
MKNPIHPGRIIKEEYLEPLNIKTNELASALGISSQTLSWIIHGNASITQEIVESLSKVFDTTPDLWIHMQANYEKK